MQVVGKVRFSKSTSFGGNQLIKYDFGYPTRLWFHILGENLPPFISFTFPFIVPRRIFEIIILFLCHRGLLYFDYIKNYL